MRDVDHVEAIDPGEKTASSATLHTIYRSYGDVRPTADLLMLIDRAAPSGDPREEVGEG